MSLRAWTFGGAGFASGGALPLESLAVRYGMSVFETIAVRRGRPIFLEEHLARLDAAAVAAALRVAPRFFGAARLRLQRFDRETGIARIYIGSAERGLLDTGGGTLAWLLFEPCEIPPRQTEWRVVSSRRAIAPVFPGLKSGNYWANVAARRDAAGAGCDEALVFNPSGELVGASMANVFLDTGGGLLTPEVGGGARNGVVREWVMARFACREARLTADDVAAATACFLTNSRIGIAPVREIDGRALTAPAAIRAIADAYRAEVLDGTLPG